MGAENRPYRPKEEKSAIMVPSAVATARITEKGLLSPYEPIRNFQTGFFKAVSDGQPVTGKALAGAWEILAEEKLKGIDPTTAKIVAGGFFEPMLKALTDDPEIIADAKETQRKMYEQAAIER